ncbi:beta-ketoacyl synthase [Stigmatella sp. ncwal1]|uniref:Beta-ketoacyl synthase n=1 Tax=Stigmatella ashevillensis TaxID=2995309 RepID=A0ABT5D642_9BACT|nr:beta-ketoacyl synthase [Stigmatella ashevillena]MDC0708333.1 beta-ketoacyl synthase [Stigmatella ashevillena]
MSFSADDDEELLAIIRETVPPGRGRYIHPEATLRQVGIDSLCMVLIIGRFLDRYPGPVEILEKQLSSVRTLRELLDLGRVARAAWVNEHGHG